MVDYHKMTIAQLRQEFKNVGRSTIKQLLTGVKGGMSKKEMADTLTRWAQQDKAIQSTAEGWAEANSCKFLGDNPKWQAWVTEFSKAK